MIDKQRLKRFIWKPEDLQFIKEESPELEIDPRKNSLLKDKILNGQEEVWAVYIQAYDKAVADKSSLPHTRAMLAVREKFKETSTGWVRKSK